MNSSEIKKVCEGAEKMRSDSGSRELLRHWPEGVKKTRQRTEIYRILAEAEKPLTASEIYERYLEASGIRCAFSTIYRCLLTFENAGVLSKSQPLTEENALYELRLEHHHHYAICLGCHERFPLRTCFLGDLRKMLPEGLQGFEITGHQLEIYGWCSKCQKTGKRQLS